MHAVKHNPTHWKRRSLVPKSSKQVHGMITNAHQIFSSQDSNIRVVPEHHDPSLTNNLTQFPGPIELGRLVEERVLGVPIEAMNKHNTVLSQDILES